MRLSKAKCCPVSLQSKVSKNHSTSNGHGSGLPQPVTCLEPFWQYVSDNALSDTSALRLAAAGKEYSFDIAAAITQIEARRKYARKFGATFAACPHFHIPTLLSGEQASSDMLAQYHVDMLPPDSTTADLTAGLGIDALHAAARSRSVTAVERDPVLAHALRMNSAAMGLHNVNVAEGDCRTLANTWVGENRYFDTVFIDPARRAADGSRVFGFADCEPDITTMLPLLRRICRRLIIKASPMLDVSAAIQSLGTVPESVVALGTATECKELVFTIDFAATPPAEPLLHASTLTGSGAQTVSFTRTQELEAAPADTKPSICAGDILYEPYPAVMKLGPFKLTAARHSLRCISAGTHLFYGSGNTDNNFPGRAYRVVETLPYASRTIKHLHQRYPAAQVAVRSFGASAEQLRARLQIKQSDAMRIFGVTDTDGKRLLLITESAQ